MQAEAGLVNIFRTALVSSSVLSTHWNSNRLLMISTGVLVPSVSNNVLRLWYLIHPWPKACFWAVLISESAEHVFETVFNCLSYDITSWASLLAAFFLEFWTFFLYRMLIGEIYSVSENTHTLSLSRSLFFFSLSLSCYHSSPYSFLFVSACLVPGSRGPCGNKKTETMYQCYLL